MTVGHSLFSAVWTVYIVVAIQIEERDLLAYYGDAYALYRRQVSMLFPIWRARGIGRDGSSWSK